jgi:RNA polymerase sigma factor (sigma-70 family)
LFTPSSRGVAEPELSALLRGDPEAWEDAFAWLWPVAFAAAQAKLQPYLPGDVEDVAIEALEELVEAARNAKSAEELKPLVASIAHHRAVSRLREHFAQKRGSGQTASLEALREQDAAPVEPVDPATSPLDHLKATELATLLGDLQQALKPEHRALISDFFLHRLSYEELAAKHGLAVGSVGVYLKRGLDALRQAAGRQPELLKELEAYLR